MNLTWRGPQIEREEEAAAAEALQEFGLRLETEAKKELYKGHGVVTGTARRSIHTASPDHNWAGDDVAPDSGTPERGGQTPDVGKKGSVLSIETGSGLEYAMALHQGHGSFAGYRFIMGPFDRIKGKFDDILAKKSKARLARLP